MEQRTLYAGSLFFDAPYIATAFTHWLNRTANAHEQVSTSITVMTFPPFEHIPAPFRGRRLMVLHFTYPGTTAAGERLAGTFRSCAPVYIDDLREIACTDVGKIHNDPKDPVAVRTGGMMLDRIGPEQVEAFMACTHGGPLVGIELRHLGGARQWTCPVAPP